MESQPDTERRGQRQGREILIGGLVGLLCAVVILAAAYSITTIQSLTTTLSSLERRATEIILQASMTAQAATSQYLAPVSATPPATSSPNPLELTATAIIQHATMTQQAILTAATPYPVDPLNLTATAIIRNATMTQQARLDATQETLLGSTFTPDPINLTVTAIIQHATMTAVALLPPTRTPTPTLTYQEVRGLHEKWLTEMEEAAGFEHPIFNMLADEFVESIDGGYIGVGPEFHPVSQVERITYEGDTYVVMLINRSESLLFGQQLFMFRVVGDEISLIPDPIQTHPVGDIMGIGDGFSDRNGNSYPDLAIGTNSGGSHPTIVLVLLEIRPGGEVVDITPEITYAYPRSLVDLDGDGILEIEALGCMRC